MKKGAVKWFLLLVCLAVCVSVAAAKSGEARNLPQNGGETDSPRLTDETIETLRLLYPDDEFGGFYLDENTLVVNITGSEEAARVRMAGSKIADDFNIEFRTVKYPLRVLENVKDFLTQHMGDYRIAALDANEVTNQVDVSLYDFSDSTFEAVEQLVAEKFGEDIPLNFIDMRGTEIKYS